MVHFFKGMSEIKPVFHFKGVEIDSPSLSLHIKITLETYQKILILCKSLENFCKFLQWEKITAEISRLFLSSIDLGRIRVRIFF